MGWSGQKNGALLALAESEFDVLITIDQSIEHQQGSVIANSARKRDTSRRMSAARRPLLTREEIDERFNVFRELTHLE